MKSDDPKSQWKLGNWNEMLSFSCHSGSWTYFHFHFSFSRLVYILLFATKPTRKYKLRAIICTPKRSWLMNTSGEQTVLSGHRPSFVSLSLSLLQWISLPFFSNLRHANKNCMIDSNTGVPDGNTSLTDQRCGVLNPLNEVLKWKKEDDIERCVCELISFLTRKPPWRTRDMETQNN